MRRALVTGGTGFIGTYLVNELVSEGLEVTVLCLPPLPEAKNENVHYVTGDIENAADLKEQILAYGPHDICYHLAWDGVAPEYKNDVLRQVKNITSTLEVMMLSKDLGCKRFVIAGTVAEYVRCEGAMDVSKRQCPSDYYGAAKVSAGYFAAVGAEQMGLEYIRTIIPSTYGPGRRDNNLLTYTIRSLLKGEKPSFGNLAQMWDFLYVGEVVRGLAYAGEKGISGKVYGIGSGIYRPLRDFVSDVRDLIDPMLPLGIGERPDMSGKTNSSCVDVSELTKDTGFVPQENFAESMKMTIEWYRQGN